MYSEWGLAEEAGAGPGILRTSIEFVARKMLCLARGRHNICH